jgi:hypothetical protein
VAHVDPLVINAVESVRNQLGADGLRSLIELARREVDRTEAAWAELGSSDDSGPPQTPGEDTRQFQAFVNEGDTEDDDLR